MKITSDSARKSNSGKGAPHAADVMAAAAPQRSGDRPVPDEWIAVAAYFRAEQRGFAPGNELGDWFQAESDYKAG